MTSSASGGAAQRSNKPRIEAASSPTDCLFKVIPDVKDAQSVVANSTAMAVRAGRALPVGALRREVAVIFDSAGKRLRGDDVVVVARDAQIKTNIGSQFFPDIVLHDRPERIGNGASWFLPDEYHERGFAIDKDGSLSFVERIRESSQYVTRFEVSSVGIVACLRPVIGAVLFARAIASQHPQLGPAWLVLHLALVPEMHLALDWDGHPLRDPRPNNYITTDREIRAGGCFDPQMDNANVESFVLKLMARLAHRFGHETSRPLLESEIRRLLGSCSVPMISSKTRTRTPSR